MTDPDSAHHAETHSGALRPVMWLGLIVSAAANATTSSTGINPYVGIGAGLVTLACATGLVVHHYRHRRK